MTSSHERNDRKSSFRGPRQGRARKPSRGGLAGDPASWLWGWHAVEAALSNPARPKPDRVMATAERAAQIAVLAPGLKVETLENGDIARCLPPGAAHQGVAVKTPPLEGQALEDVAMPTQGVLLMLDQVTDPQNVGAILRSAAAFGVRGVVMQDRHAPQLGGALAKAAAGAVDKVSVVRAVNLARALDKLSDLGWTIVGLAGTGDQSLEQALDGAPIVLVMGSEGEGMRRLVQEHCDRLARIPMPGGFESLNVAAAAAVALYEASRKHSASVMDARATGERT